MVQRTRRRRRSQETETTRKMESECRCKSAPTPLLPHFAVGERKFHAIKKSFIFSFPLPLLPLSFRVIFPLLHFFLFFLGLHAADLSSFSWAAIIVSPTPFLTVFKLERGGRREEGGLWLFCAASGPRPGRRSVRELPNWPWLGPSKNIVAPEGSGKAPDHPRDQIDDENSRRSRYSSERIHPTQKRKTFVSRTKPGPCAKKEGF